MTKLSNAVIAGAALLVAGFDPAIAAQPGFRGGAPHAGAPAISRVAPVMPRAAPAVPHHGAPFAAPRFAPAPSGRMLGTMQPQFVMPGTHVGLRPPNPALANQHLRSRAPIVAGTLHLIPHTPPAAALDRRGHRAHARDHRGRHFVGRSISASPYFFGYGAGLGAPYVSGGYLVGNRAYGVCFPLLQKYRETGADRWRRRYDKCLAGDYSELDYL